VLADVGGEFTSDLDSHSDTDCALAAPPLVLVLVLFNLEKASWDLDLTTRASTVAETDFSVWPPVMPLGLAFLRDATMKLLHMAMTVTGKKDTKLMSMYTKMYSWKLNHSSEM
jgi:hypothetical protein